MQLIRSVIRVILKIFISIIAYDNEFLIFHQILCLATSKSIKDLLPIKGKLRLLGVSEILS